MSGQSESNPIISSTHIACSPIDELNVEGHVRPARLYVFQNLLRVQGSHTQPRRRKGYIPSTRTIAATMYVAADIAIRWHSTWYRLNGYS